MTDQAIAAMISLGATIENIAAAIGPCLAKASFEVGHDFAEHLAEDDPENERFLGEGQRHRLVCDTAARNGRLGAAGVALLMQPPQKHLAFFRRK